MRTGGTSASPFTFEMDTFARRQKERAYLFDIWASCGYRPFDLRVVYRGNIEEKLISYSVLENCYVISPSMFGMQNRQDVFEFLRNLPPFFLHVYPSSLFTFVSILGEDAFRQLPIRGVLAGSEVFPSAQLQQFERKFGLRVAHWYGHSEYATLASRCRRCGGFHFYPTYGFTELVPDESGRYRIVATSFNTIGTRFVRYDTGDLARPGRQDCPEPFLRVDAIEGREQEFFIDRDRQRRAFGPYLFGIHNEFWDRIDAIQFLQRRPGSLDVRIVARDTRYHPWLEAYLQERFAVCNLRFEYVDKIVSTKAGKHRYYVSEI
jgi:phenylacetate-CoA ligase